MRYGSEHKTETRGKILKSASRKLRSLGIDGVSIAGIMQDLKLTHGGFYGHFPGKAALVVEACEDAFRESRERMAAHVNTFSGRREKLEAFLEIYLSRQHCEKPEVGCLVPTLASELARQPAEVRKAFEKSLTNHLSFFSELLDLAFDDLLMVLSASAGAITVARTVESPELKSRALEATRKRLLEFFGRDKTPEEQWDPHP